MTLARRPFDRGILNPEDPFMRRMYLSVITLIAAGALSAQTASTQTTQPAAPATAGETQLVTTTAVKSTDSPLVQAAKRALAARQNAKNRIKIDHASMKKAGRVSQSTGPVNVSFNLPTSDGEPARPAPRDSAEEARQKELEKKLETLKQEQAMMAAEQDEPYGGDIEEGASDQRMTEIPNEIEQTQREMNPPPPGE
jgi:hypothetical protein